VRGPPFFEAGGFRNKLVDEKAVCLVFSGSIVDGQGDIANASADFDSESVRALAYPYFKVTD
jgi:hypothetical protein